MSKIEVRLAELDIKLPPAPAAIANYVPAYRLGDVVHLSGQLCLDRDGKLAATGQVGSEVDIATAQMAARCCALNLLAQLKNAVGSLDEVKGVIRLGGFISAGPDFADHAVVMNGASDLMVEIFGDVGRHVRSTVGVSSLPKRASVEVEGTFLV